MEVSASNVSNVKFEENKNVHVLVGVSAAWYVGEFLFHLVNQVNLNIWIVKENSLVTGQVICGLNRHTAVG